MRVLEWHPEDWSPEASWFEAARREDRRQSNRRPIEFEVIEGRGPAAVSAWACDVSPTGIQTEAELALPFSIRSTIPMLLFLPRRSHPLRTSATLVWRSGKRAGFKFAAMSDVDRLEIAEMVDRVEQTRHIRIPCRRRDLA
ncbi:MAG: PilZ domain-containing protein [Polyangiaceae bacterium]|nr:PilZ domain-containing protein [Polyangiaceae bacterium]